MYQLYRVLYNEYIQEYSIPSYLHHAYTANALKKKCENESNKLSTDVLGAHKTATTLTTRHRVLCNRMLSHSRLYELYGKRAAIAYVGVYMGCGCLRVCVIRSVEYSH